MVETLLQPGTEAMCRAGTCQVVKTDGQDRIVLTMPETGDGRLPELYGVEDYYFQTAQGIVRARGQLVERYQAENQKRMAVRLTQGFYRCGTYEMPEYTPRNGISVQVRREQEEYVGKITSISPEEVRMTLNMEEPFKKDSRLQMFFLEMELYGAVVRSELAPSPDQCVCTAVFLHQSTEGKKKILEYILLHGE